MSDIEHLPNEDDVLGRMLATRPKPHKAPKKLDPKHRMRRVEKGAASE